MAKHTMLPNAMVEVKDGPIGGVSASYLTQIMGSKVLPCPRRTFSRSTTMLP